MDSVPLPLTIVETLYGFGFEEEIGRALFEHCGEIYHVKEKMRIYYNGYVVKNENHILGDNYSFSMKIGEEILLNYVKIDEINNYLTSYFRKQKIENLLKDG